MITSLVHAPCSVSLHLASEDVFVHPPPPSSEYPGEDKTLRGLVEIKCPSERTIQGIKVTLQGIQTLAFPEAAGGGAAGLRWEEKIIMNKTVEIMDDGSFGSGGGGSSGGGLGGASHGKSAKAKGKERQKDALPHAQAHAQAERGRPRAPLVLSTLSSGASSPRPAAAPAATAPASASANASPAVHAAGPDALAPPPAASPHSDSGSAAPAPSPGINNVGLPGIEDPHDGVERQLGGLSLQRRANGGASAAAATANGEVAAAAAGTAPGTPATPDAPSGGGGAAAAQHSAGTNCTAHVTSDKARLTAPDVPVPYTSTRREGLHLEKGVHGFEFAFIIPATSPPFERTKNGRVRYIVTATALGAGRGLSNVSTWQEVFVMLHVQPDGGPTPLDVQFHDVHEALGAMSVSLISASLTVGGTANLAVYHPDPPAGVSVHVIRVCLEQTMELYSSLRKAWLKLPSEKLRLWEKGYMPYRAKQIDAGLTPEDAIWIAQGTDVPGKAGRGAGNGPAHIHPFGPPMNGSISRPQTPGEPMTPASNSGAVTPGGAFSYGSGAGAGGYFGTTHSSPGSGGGHAQTAGYKLRSVVRLPDDQVIRPSTVRGCKTDIRVTHEIGVEIFFSRLSVLDDREHSESYGKPKVQVFSMRRAVAIPSCCCTYDTIHLPPYSLESPVNSRPPSPVHSASGGGGAGGHASSLGKRSSLADLEHWKATTPLKHVLPGSGGALGFGTGSGSAHSKKSSPASSAPASRPISRPGSRAGSRDASPTRHGFAAAFASATGHGRKSRPSSPERAAPIPVRSKSGLHAFTPSNPTSAPGSGAVSPSIAAPRSLPLSSSAGAAAGGGAGILTGNGAPPWAAHSFFTARTATSSHQMCNCGRTTEELSEAEQRLLEGVPTAPGAWVDSHDEGDLPPPWLPPSRVGSPVQGWHYFGGGNREGGRARGKLAEIEADY